MDYEDDEIWWLEENEDWEVKKGWTRMMSVNFAIRIRNSTQTFDVVKNRWGATCNNITLNFLDDVLDNPESVLDMIGKI